MFPTTKLFSTESSILLLEMVPNIFFSLVRFSKLRRFIALSILLFLNEPGSCTESDGVQRTSLLQLHHQSLFSLRLLKRLACSLLVSVSPGQPGLYSAVHITTSRQHLQSYYLLASIRREIRATSSWDQRRKWMSQFWISQKCRGNKPAPTKRESEGKSGRSLNRLECCPTTGSLW